MDKITFSVNGVKCRVGGEVSSDVTLLDYLRGSLELRGTKYMCRQGICGACIVSVVKSSGEDPIAVNGCLVPITSCSNWEITTIEKVGNRKDGYHPIQETFADNNATQCGYCTPGWILAMYSLLKSNDNLTMLEIEKSFATNICRCTGYRPILKALKMFGTDAPESDRIHDIEDLQKCKKTCKDCRKCSKDVDWCLLNEDDIPNILEIELKDGKRWFRVSTISDIFDVLEERGEDSYKLVAGNTAEGVPNYRSTELPSTLIDVSGVSELKGFSQDQNLIISAGTTLTKLLEIIKEVAEEDGFHYLKTFKDHLQLVGNIAVRNIGTIAGNLMVKNQNPGFTSDIYLLFCTVDAQLTIRNRSESTTVSMVEFLEKDMKGHIIVNVLLPPLSDQHKVLSYKIMPRAQNASAFLNAGFSYHLSSDNTVEGARIFFSGLTSGFSRATNTESYLAGKNLFTNETLQEALKIMESELEATENPPDPSPEYRKEVALGLFYKGLLSICPSDILNRRFRSEAGKIREERSLTSGIQEFSTDESVWPINKPLTKVEALRQCAAEVPFTDDIPSLPQEVFAAFVLATEPLGKIVNIDASKALDHPGVIACYTAKDIPGVNAFTPDYLVLVSPIEEVLCDGDVKYYNQPVAIVVAESRHLADKATKMVEVTYENVSKPMTDIKKAKDESSRVTEIFSLPATRRGNDVAKTINGSKTTYSQYHFPMETLVCVTVPSEDGFKVYNSTQWVDGTQWCIHKALNIPSHNIDVHCRRLGGAFGIKITRSTQQAIACTLVASKLNRPCRFIQSLSTNIRAVGKRFPCNSDFLVSVNKSGKIQYANYNLYADNGYVINDPIGALTAAAFNNAYDSSRWTFTGYNVTTDTHKNTTCRAPGTFEAIAMAEFFMERIAYEQSLDPAEVRLQNLDTEKYNDLKEMYENLKEKADFVTRKAEVNEFNANNRWRKRGLSVAFMRFTPIGGQNLNIVLSVFHSDGTVGITHSGIEMGQGINTKAVQIAAHTLGIPVEKIKIKGNNSMIGPNAFFTGFSTTTANVCRGVKRACEDLLRRLEPVKRVMSNDATWEEIIERAYELTINLQTQGYASLLEAVYVYDIFGVCFAEVEVDILTGETEVLRVDILEDAGRSLNPEIDIGQIEGSFIMGMGTWTSEDVVYNRENGEILSDSAWTYHVLQARDIPRDFRVYFRENSLGREENFGSKATSEPPICLSLAVPLAIHEAIGSSRREADKPAWVQIDGPYTLERVRMASAVSTSDYKFT